mmetsp:Transcript_63019/g.111964  ORF Transcript_63019/g.111964 Transcript_63019/m.111964 type:complete len:804 (-) Transcript_63019:253-2664(-)|eukprot:CAMPEP_0197661428 /NCGR_PEP_ID=MMETSP1338-20131121/51448_1 /TAXON_ID=43686 ORGANISM="Pelagodinium beii, Strain RCC1491" /NCGR_SAMPLE_ID=MMETSP1338 /ASSEMBLY_ACC=CAM_ASM_000754 /LENGTH=803 /DNA_ID=CAMNT_0043238981 /DNA_START=113 /DNA_END=2524 /DNA_ORIENTATION=+
MKQSSALLVLLLATCHVEARKTYTRKAKKANVIDPINGLGPVDSFEMPSLELPAEGLEDIAQVTVTLEPDAQEAKLELPEDVVASPGFEVSDYPHTGVALPALSTHLDKVSESKNRLKALDKIEHSVKNLAQMAADEQDAATPTGNSTRVSDDLMGMIDQIREKIWEMFMPELRKQENLTNYDLNMSAQAVWDTMTYYSDNWPNLYSIYAPSLTLHEGKHRKCRKAEWAKLQILNYRTGLLRAKKDVKTKYCTIWCNNETGSAYPGSICEYDATLYTGTYWVLDFYDDQYEFWNSLAAIIRVAREKCEEKTLHWCEEYESYNQTLAEYNALKLSCEYEQDQLDDVSCDWKSKLDPVCKNYTELYHDSMVSYNETWQAAKEQEIYLRDQMHAILRILCYLDAFTADNVKSAINKCRFMGDQVSYFRGDICPAGEQIPDAAECATASNLMIGDQPFEYQGTRKEDTKPQGCYWYITQDWTGKSHRLSYWNTGGDPNFKQQSTAGSLCKQSGDLTQRYLLQSNVTEIFFVDRALPLWHDCEYNWTHVASNAAYVNKYYADCAPDHPLWSTCDASCCFAARTIDYTTTTTTIRPEMCWPNTGADLTMLDSITETSLLWEDFQVSARCKTSGASISAVKCRTKGEAYTFPDASKCTATCVTPTVHPNYDYIETKPYLLKFSVTATCKADGSAATVTPCTVPGGKWGLSGCATPEEMFCLASSSVPAGATAITETSLSMNNFTVTVTCDSGDIRQGTICANHGEAYTLPSCTSAPAPLVDPVTGSVCPHWASTATANTGICSVGGVHSH